VGVAFIASERMSARRSHRRRSAPVGKARISKSRITLMGLRIFTATSRYASYPAAAYTGRERLRPRPARRNQARTHGTLRSLDDGSAGDQGWCRRVRSRPNDDRRVLPRALQRLDELRLSPLGLAVGPNGSQRYRTSFHSARSAEQGSSTTSDVVSKRMVALRCSSYCGQPGSP
jgi:hypothetical protein